MILIVLPFSSLIDKDIYSIHLMHDDKNSSIVLVFNSFDKIWYLNFYRNYEKIINKTAKERRLSQDL